MDDLQQKRRTWLICAGLAVAILVAYSPVWHSQFVLFDDNDYVTNNGMVKRGLTWQGIVWAFSTFHASNWHPLTWISHMLDVQIFGLNPGGHHATNLLLHAANSVLLFLLLQRMTRATWPSALVAALFALHPMHVESVAWVSERKDVLSAFFWMLTLWAYVRYTEETAANERNAWKYYAGSVVLFALGLMAKPMLVTLPLVLILLDLWPLQRWRPPWGRLLMEKVPYLALSAASCVVTVLAQKSGGAVTTLADLPLQRRLALVPVAYVRYLAKTFWPDHLAVWYPLPSQWRLGPVVGAGALLALITGCVLWRWRVQCYLAVGWFWFLGVLAPVIGLVHIGGQAMADRYDYLPSIGLFIAIVWAGREWLPRLGAGVMVVLGGLSVAGCLTATVLQAGYWKNSETLFRHTLAVTENNALIENNLGHFLWTAGRMEEAASHLIRAVELAPNYAEAHYNLGQVFLAEGRVPEALAEFERQAALVPGDFVAQYNFGGVLLDQGLAQAAVLPLQRAVRLRPNDAEAHLKLGGALRQVGRAAEAVSQYEQSLQLRANWLQPAAALAWMLATSPDASVRNGPRAVQWGLLSQRLSGGRDPRVLGILAAAYAEAGDFPKAVAAAQHALQLAGAEGDPALGDTLRTQLAGYRAGQPVRDAPPPKARL